MKTRLIIAALLALALGIAPSMFETSRAATPQKSGGNSIYTARLLSPKAGEVVRPGQVVKIEWESTIPDLDMTWCEQELYLSLDGGKTVHSRVTPQLDPMTRFFHWTVPNTPSSAAVLDIHFGCEGYFPETPSVQHEFAFSIGRPRGEIRQVVINSVSTSLASPGDAVQIAWDSNIKKVKYFEVFVSHNRGAHFHSIGKTKDLQYAWNVPADFAGHATFQVVAHTRKDRPVRSGVSAEPEVVVRARE